jgi:predicted DNA-binding protein YlxM (UPF0122 family)
MIIDNIGIGEIAEIYGISRQRIHQCNAKFNLVAADWLDPDRIFSAQLTGCASSIRQRLIDPHRRENTRELIRLAIECRKTALEALRKARI